MDGFFLADPYADVVDLLNNDYGLNSFIGHLVLAWRFFGVTPPKTGSKSRHHFTSIRFKGRESLADLRGFD